MSSAIDQKRLISMIKHDLEEWRELILIINSLLKWEKKYYPAVLFGIISIIFILLWYLDLSTLSLISLILLFAAITDYTLPMISKIIFKPQNWNGPQENKYEEICNEICKLRMKLYSFYNLLFTAKEQKSTTFIIVVTAVLLLLAWIGSVLDNLLLSYLTVLCITFYPGLQHHGFTNTIKNNLSNILSSKLQLLKEKTIKKN